MLFERSFEYGDTGGSAAPRRRGGYARGIPESLKVPHIGWNALRFRQPDHPLFRYIKEGTACTSCIASTPQTVRGDARTAEYGAELTAAVGSKNVLGCQIHPERAAGSADILRAFCEL